MLRQCPAPFGGAVFDYRIRLIFLNETAAHCINSIPILAEEPALGSVSAFECRQCRPLSRFQLTLPGVFDNYETQEELFPPNSAILRKHFIRAILALRMQYGL